MSRYIHWNLFGLLILSIIGCDQIPNDLKTQLQKSLATLSAWIGGDSSSTDKSNPKPSPTSEKGLIFSQEAKNAKANAEFLHEMIQVVHMKEPQSRAEFGNLVDTLNQGASLEGIYNGLTHSSEYRKFEMAQTGATPEAVRIFGEELAYLELELPVPTEFDAASASPLPVLGTVDLTSAVPSGIDSVRSAGMPNGSPTPQIEHRVLAEKYIKQFIGASIFTLKRVLGDEGLKVVGVKNEYPEKLALWYSKWVVRLCQRNVDFGVALRNSPDEAFHYKWALENNFDRVRWEVLNRLHRIMNEANRPKQ